MRSASSNEQFENDKLEKGNMIYFNVKYSTRSTELCYLKKLNY